MHDVESENEIVSISMETFLITTLRLGDRLFRRSLRVLLMSPFGAQVHIICSEQA